LPGRRACRTARRRSRGGSQSSRRDVPQRRADPGLASARHFSFASTHPGKNAFDTIVASYGPQVLWPDHCIQETPGAQFHRALQIPHASLVVRKVHDRAIDSYSAFYENDRTTPTGLAGYLRERGIKRVFLAGLAFDFCVRYSAEDARRGDFSVIVIEDACRGIDVADSVAATRASLAGLGVPCLVATELGS
jgi:nicotinamidase/pyrazinamidase